MPVRYDCVILKRSAALLMTPVILSLVLLACGTSLTDTAAYVCPTPLPATVIPLTVGPGTPMVLPTLVPTVTPFRLFSPQPFYAGDAVFVGQPGSAVRLRFRLHSVQSRVLSGQALYTWALDIRNLGTAAYETFPVAQAVITQMRTTNGVLNGVWRTSERAMKAAGFTTETYDPLQPGVTHTYRLAAYGPVGSILRLAFQLDETGQNQITWLNQRNPFCAGDVAD